MEENIISFLKDKAQKMSFGKEVAREVKQSVCSICFKAHLTQGVTKDNLSKMVLRFTLKKQSK